MHQQVPRRPGELVPVAPRAFRPSASWGDGGPFIEREHIDLVSDFGRWMARHGQRDDYSRADVSPLVTAMRAYLMREYGDEVSSTWTSVASALMVAGVNLRGIRAPVVKGWPDADVTTSSCTGTAVVLAAGTT